MQEIILVFPHQLYSRHPAATNGLNYMLVEEWLFFSQYAFHFQKLVFHRASMKAYAEKLEQSGEKVEYIEARKPEHDIRKLMPALAKRGIRKIHVAEISDNWLSKRLATAAYENGVEVISHPDPGFINDKKSLDAFFEGRKRYFQTDFYVHQRKKLGILVDKEKNPLGGKWTFDTENRKRYPARTKPPRPIVFPADAHTLEAMEYVKKYFPKNPGIQSKPLEEGYPWAWTHAAAETVLEDFLENRARAFGDYEDAMVADEHFLHHSILSPLINTGLLTPAQVLEKTLHAAARENLPLNSTEGFIRQIIGWREFIRAIYLREGSYQRTHNYWGFKRPVPQAFYTGTTGIVPIDAVIRKLLQTGYSHHIERLMVLGNFFLLCEFDPDHVYRWFMEMYIDAYDWVMVPNVYGMTQFADGGLMTTKPYLSGSNYLMKMGDWQKGDALPDGSHWQEVWDGLFWRFMHVHRSFFQSNPRLGMLLKTFDKMDAAKREKHLRIASSYLASLDPQ